jgi:hypothetical protein
MAATGVEAGDDIVAITKTITKTIIKGKTKKDTKLFTSSNRDLFGTNKKIEVLEFKTQVKQQIVNLSMLYYEQYGLQRKILLPNPLQFDSIENRLQPQPVKRVELFKFDAESINLLICISGLVNKLTQSLQERYMAVADPHIKIWKWLLAQTGDGVHYDLLKFMFGLLRVTFPNYDLPKQIDETQIMFVSMPCNTLTSAIKYLYDLIFKSIAHYCANLKLTTDNKKTTTIHVAHIKTFIMQSDTTFKLTSDFFDIIDQYTLIKKDVSMEFQTVRTLVTPVLGSPGSATNITGSPGSATNGIGANQIISVDVSELGDDIT